VIPLHNYIPALLDEIISNFPNSSLVQVETRLQELVMDAKTLQPLGIILNELITNIMKYAFPERKRGRIRVTATRQPTGIQITVEDDGIGIPEHIDFDKSTGFGLQLVQALTVQLKASIRIERTAGTTVILDIPYIQLPA
jgi:two-component sensor histidine kinase